ncbi:MAG: hypothetical protein H7A08_02955 [Oceanospirillaceae bacterium]|nr:hypothetical protein [Oceanospirillaceae bacterium]
MHPTALKKYFKKFVRFPPSATTRSVCTLSASTNLRNSTMNMRTAAALALTLISSAALAGESTERKCGAGSCGKKTVTSDKTTDASCSKKEASCSKKEASCSKKDMPAEKDAACSKKEASCSKKDAACSKK